MSYRPITDTWILARAKLTEGHKYYGAYPGGFPERARKLLGVTLNDSVLHVCGGRVRNYPYKNAIGPNDRTLDLDPELEPDFLQDARESFPMLREWGDGFSRFKLWDAILMDPPYSVDDANYYKPGGDKYPTPSQLLKNAIETVRPGGRVGILHFLSPTPPKGSFLVAWISVITGHNNKIRLFSVYEKEV
jgi:hypothetical protein